MQDAPLTPGHSIASNLIRLAGLHVLLAVLLVAQELGVHALAAVVLLLLRLLDAVAVLLVSLVMGGMVGGLGHPVRTL